jgi:hypothetical protein
MEKMRKSDGNSAVKETEAAKRKGNESVDVDKVDFESIIMALNDLEPREKLGSKLAIVRRLYPYIKEAQARGITATKIAETLTEKTGVSFTLNTLRNALGNIQRKSLRRKESDKP